MRRDIPWKCDICGRFAKFSELGASRLFVPSSAVSYEESIFRCKSCTDKHGKPTSNQQTVLNIVSWINTEPRPEAGKEGEGMSYIVQLEPGVYLVPWSGDPGRTLSRLTARQYKGISAATYALARARRFRDFVNATIEPAHSEPKGSK